MPLRELMRNFFDEIKSISSGFASISYTLGELREADVARMDLLVADEPVLAFCRIVSRKRLEEEAKSSVEKLHKVLASSDVYPKNSGQSPRPHYRFRNSHRYAEKCHPAHVWR
jgi:translation elongation factor EF-4